MSRRRRTPRGRPRTASRARRRTSSATRASGRRAARSPRSPRGRAGPAGGASAMRSGYVCRGAPRTPLGVGQAQVDRLDELGRRRSRSRAPRGGARAGRGLSRVVGRNGRAQPPPARRGSGRRRRRRRSCPGARRSVRRRQRGDGAVDDGEHLAPARVDHGQRARRAGGERVERRDTAPRAGRARAPARGAAARPMRSPVKLPGPVPTTRPSSCARPHAAAAEQRVHVLEQRERPRRRLGEHLAVPDERARGDVGCGVPREQEHE